MAQVITKYSLLGFPLASAGLGVWQLKRLEWKKNLIAQLEEKTKMQPIDLMDINSASELNELEYRRVRARGHFDPDPNHQLYLKPRQLVVNEEAVLRGRTSHQPSIGVHVITPFQVDGSNLRILVNRGWLSSRGRDNVAENSHLGLGHKEPIEIVGIIRKTDKRSTYGSKNDETKNEWQFRDIDAMARALSTAPIYIEAEQEPNRTGGPYGGQTQLTVRNEHLNYAITWFSLAVLSYAMWHSRYIRGKRFK